MGLTGRFFDCERPCRHCCAYFLCRDNDGTNRGSSARSDATRRLWKSGAHDVFVRVSYTVTVSPQISPAANLAAELSARRTQSVAFNAAQGNFSDAPQLCPRCPVGGLNAKARDDRRQVTGKVCRLDFCREFAFRLRLLQTLLQSRFTTFSPIDHRQLYRFRIRATCQRPLD